MTTFGVKRKEKKMTQSELASKLNVSQQVVAKWELGKTKPSVNNLIKIASVFGCTVDELLKDEKEVVS